MAKAKIAVSYVRVSGLGQKDGDGPERQRLAIAKYAKRQRLTVAQEFADLGVSGTLPGTERPGMVGLLASAVALGANVVLVERADRLARDLIEGEVLLRTMRSMGLQVVAADSGLDLTADDGDPTKALVRQVLGAFAEYDKASIVLKLRAARERKRLAGERCEGRKPYGSREGEDAALVRLREIARGTGRGRKRPTWQAIADQANAEGLPTRGGKPWSRGSVHALLTR